MNDDLEHNPNARLSKPVPELPDITVQHEPINDLQYTRKVRGMIVKGIAGEGIPSDPKALGMLLNTLKDLDSAALGQMRIKSEEKGQDLQAQQQALVREYLAQAAGSKPPTRKEPAEVQTPSLDDSVVVRDFVPGELQQGTISRTFEEFTADRTDVTLAAEDAKD